MPKPRSPSDAFPFDRKTLWWCLSVTAAIEFVCVVLRFGFDLESTSATASTIGVLTFGYRVHHGYIGALAIPASIAVDYGSHSWRRWIFVVGVGLLVSDIVHHFLVLWPITGSPQFDLFYPAA